MITIGRSILIFFRNPDRDQIEPFFSKIRLSSVRARRTASCAMISGEREGEIWGRVGCWFDCITVGSREVNIETREFTELISWFTSSECSRTVSISILISSEEVFVFLDGVDFIFTQSGCGRRNADAAEVTQMRPRKRRCDRERKRANEG